MQGEESSFLRILKFSKQDISWMGTDYGVDTYKGVHVARFDKETGREIPSAKADWCTLKIKKAAGNVMAGFRHASTFAVSTVGDSNDSDSGRPSTAFFGFGRRLGSRV